MGILDAYSLIGEFSSFEPLVVGSAFDKYSLLKIGAYVHCIKLVERK